MRLLLALVLGTLLSGLGALSGLLFYDRYWRWRDCFNELGRCYDPVSQDVYLEQAGGIYGTFAVIFLGLGLWLLHRARYRQRQGRARAKRRGRGSIY